MSSEERNPSLDSLMMMGAAIEAAAGSGDQASLSLSPLPQTTKMTTTNLRDSATSNDGMDMTVGSLLDDIQDPSADGDGGGGDEEGDLDLALLETLFYPDMMLFDDLDGYASSTSIGGASFGAASGSHRRMSSFGSITSISSRRWESGQESAAAAVFDDDSLAAAVATPGQERSSLSSLAFAQELGQQQQTPLTPMAVTTTTTTTTTAAAPPSTAAATAAVPPQLAPPLSLPQAFAGMDLLPKNPPEQPAPPVTADIAPPDPSMMSNIPTTLTNAAALLPNPTTTAAPLGTAATTAATAPPVVPPGAVPPGLAGMPPGAVPPYMPAAMFPGMMPGAPNVPGTAPSAAAAAFPSPEVLMGAFAGAGMPQPQQPPPAQAVPGAEPTGPVIPSAMAGGAMAMGGAAAGAPTPGATQGAPPAFPAAGGMPGQGATISTEKASTAQLISQFTELASRLGVALPTTVLQTLKQGRPNEQGAGGTNKTGDMEVSQKTSEDDDEDGNASKKMTDAFAESLEQTAAAAIAAVDESRRRMMDAIHGGEGGIPLMSDNKKKRAAPNLTEAENEDDDDDDEMPAATTKKGKATNAAVRQGVIGVGRRTKKPRMDECSRRLEQLREENEVLKRHLAVVTNKTEQCDRERLAAQREMRQVYENPELTEKEREARLTELLDKFASMYSDFGRIRQQELNFHLNQLERLVIPTTVTKMSLWTLGQGKKFFTQPDRNPIAGILIRELGMTPAQIRRVADQRKRVRQVCQNIRHSLILLNRLKALCHHKQRVFADRMGRIKDILRPIQTIKLLLWVEDNSAALMKVCPQWDAERIRTIQEMSASPSTTTTAGSGGGDAAKSDAADGETEDKPKA